MTTWNKPEVALRVRLVTHNIRYAASDLEPGEQPWNARAPLIINQLRHETQGFGSPFNSNSTAPSSEGRLCEGAFICLQEVLHNQLIDVLSGLNRIPDKLPSATFEGEGWAYVGVGRDDGKREGEYNPILYNSRLFRPIYSHTYWLSPTPWQPSRGWDAGSNRILTLAVFEHKQSKCTIVLGNTHLDNVGNISRVNSIPLILTILRQMESMYKDSDVPAPKFEVLTGDFNSQPNEEAYQAMKCAGYLHDVFECVPPDEHYGNHDTFTGFDPKSDEDGMRIDFIWLRPPSASSHGIASVLPWKVEGCAVLPNKFQDGVYLSDHRAVIADVLLTWGLPGK